MHATESEKERERKKERDSGRATLSPSSSADASASSSICACSKINSDFFTAEERHLRDIDTRVTRDVSRANTFFERENAFFLFERKRFSKTYQETFIHTNIQTPDTRVTRDTRRLRKRSIKHKKRPLHIWIYRHLTFESRDTRNSSQSKYSTHKRYRETRLYTHKKKEMFIYMNMQTLDTRVTRDTRRENVFFLEKTPF